MARIALYLLTNLAILAMAAVVIQVTGLDGWLTAHRVSWPSLLGFSAVIGFFGSTVSLLLSKPVARWSTGAVVVTGHEDAASRWLVDTVRRLSYSAGIGYPEVAVYPGPPNAFATGAHRDHALVAVSSGLLASMPRAEVEAVLAHEIGHVASGDMVTLSLLQGVLNTFVIFASRVIGSLVDSRNGETHRREGTGYFITVFAAQATLGLLASVIVAWFSRQREFRADAASARLIGGSQPMIAALTRLQQGGVGGLPPQLAAFGIGAPAGWLRWFASHPPLEERIDRLMRHEG
jgi:heat shock protein HtpX